jgi:hypothetical protein
MRTTADGLLAPKTATLLFVVHNRWERLTVDRFALVDQGLRTGSDSRVAAVVA